MSLTEPGWHTSLGLEVPVGERDEITGLLDRDGFVASADRALAVSQQLQLVRVRVHRLAAIMQVFGVEVREIVLRSVAEALRTTFRATDVIGDIGDGEFAVVCSGAVPAQALSERITASVSALTHALPAPVHVDVLSLRLRATTTIQRELQRSDGALHLAGVKNVYRRAGLRPAIGR